MTGRPALLLAAAAGALLLPGCGSTAAATSASVPSSQPPAGTADGAVGALRVDGAYIPQQASPDVAAAYLRVTNDGSTADALVSASSPAATMVMLHETVAHGDVGSMVPLAALPVPAHASVALTVGSRHLMLMSPPRMLTQGEVVPVTVHFAVAGDLTLMVPVVGFAGPGGDG